MSEHLLIDRARTGSVDEIRALVAQGADVNERDEHGWTPLCHAAGAGNTPAIAALAEAGADVFAAGKDDRTPYRIAVAASQAETAKQLAELEQLAGGDTEKVSSQYGETRPYCKAYLLETVAAFPNWPNMENDSAGGGESDAASDTVFIHQDYTVTRSVWHNEDVLLGDVTPEWIAFCREQLHFSVPSDLDLIPNES